MKILKPKYYVPHMKISSALHGYDMYSPPHKSNESSLTEEEAKENFDFFMISKNNRVMVFIKWIEDNFYINLDYSADSIAKLSDWMAIYAPVIVRVRKNLFISYYKYNPEWNGKFIGCNLIFDIGLYIGEYLIKKRSFLHWDMYKYNNVIGDMNKSQFYNKPFIAGSFYEIGNVIFCPFWECSNAVGSELIFSNVKINKSDTLRAFVSQAIYMADIPAHAQMQITEDVKNGPLE